MVISFHVLTWMLSLIPSHLFLFIGLMYDQHNTNQMYPRVTTMEPTGEHLKIPKPFIKLVIIKQKYCQSTSRQREFIQAHVTLFTMP